MKFTAYDIINKKPIDLYMIILSSCGGIIVFQDLQGEQYGHHQIHLSVDISELTNETVFKGVDESFSVGQDLVLGQTENWTGVQSVTACDKTLTDDEVESLMSDPDITPEEEMKRLEEKHKASPSFTGKPEGGADGNIKR